MNCQYCLQAEATLVRGRNRFTCNACAIAAMHAGAVSEEIFTRIDSFPTGRRAVGGTDFDRATYLLRSVLADPCSSAASVSISEVKGILARNQNTGDGDGSFTEVKWATCSECAAKICESNHALSCAKAVLDA